MYISNILSSCEQDGYMDEDIEESPEHRALEERLRKTLYYGRSPGSDRPSMPLTELAVEYFRDAAPKPLGRVDMDFASSVGRKAYASPCSLMLGLMYLNRLKKHGNPDYLQQVSSSDLFIISMMIASKYLYDEGTDEEVFNDEWADAAGMDTEDINQLELDFLRETGWQLFVNEKEFADVLRKVEMTIAFRKGRERGGSFTYTDLHALTDDDNLLLALNAILVEMTKVVAVCMVAYIAGVITVALAPTALSVSISCSQHSWTTDRIDRSSEPFAVEHSAKHSAEHSTLAACSSCSKFNACGTPTRPSIVSVIKDFVGLSASSGQSLSKDHDLLCEHGPCGLSQMTSSLGCVNVTSVSLSCTTTPCCCCQPMPNLNDHLFTNFPYARVTVQTEAVR